MNGTWEEIALQTTVVPTDPELGKLVIAFLALAGGFWFLLKAFDYAARGYRQAVKAGRKTYHAWRKRFMAGKLMARWKKTVVGDYLYDAILTMEVKGVINRHEARVIESAIAKALDMPELLPRKLYKLATRAYFLGMKDKDGNVISPPKYEKLAGPKDRIPGAPDGTYVPRVENVVPKSEFLRRLAEKKAA